MVETDHVRPISILVPPAAEELPIAVLMRDEEDRPRPIEDVAAHEGGNLPCSGVRGERYGL